MNRSARNVLVALGVIVLGWAIAAVVLVPARRWTSWDEAVYFAKASPDFPTITWAAERDIGFPGLLWPVVGLGGSLLAARVELLLLCALGAFAAYATWVASIGSAAPAAAVLFLSSWPALFYGSELYPHMVVGIALVGALGSATNAVTRAATGPAIAAFAFTAFASCIRPSDVLLMVAVAVPVLFLLERRRAIRAIVALVAGVAVGCVVWAIEAFLVFDSPLARWRDAFGRTPPRNPRRGLLAGLAHRGLDTDLGSAPVVAAVAWTALLAALLVAGVVVARRRHQLVAVLPAALGAVLIVGAYSVYWSDTGARFFIPGFALASVPAGVAVQAAWRAARAGAAPARVLGAMTCAAVLVAVVAHGHATRAIGADEREVRAADRATGRAMARIAGGRPCRFVAQFNFPAIELASGCDGVPARYDQSPDLLRRFRYARPGTVRFAAGPNPPVAASSITRWEELPVPGAPGVRLYVAPEAQPARG
jgi:hypothetical protein